MTSAPTADRATASTDPSAACFASIPTAAYAYAAALDQARTAPDEFPGEEIGAVDPADYDLTLIDRSDDWTLTLAHTDGLDLEQRVTITWLPDEQFWTPTH